jgi:hypothetical protein
MNHPDSDRRVSDPLSAFPWSSSPLDVILVPIEPAESQVSRFLLDRMGIIKDDSEDAVSEEILLAS